MSSLVAVRILISVNYMVICEAYLLHLTNKRINHAVKITYKSRTENCYKVIVKVTGFIV